MSEGEQKERRWLRPLGLFALVLALAIGQPLVLIGVPFALLAFAIPGQRLAGVMVGAVLVALVFAGAPGAGLWYLERGWAVVVAGWFVAVTLVVPQQRFLMRALISLAGSVAWCGAVLVGMGAWDRAQGLIVERIDEGAATTMELFGMVSGSDGVGTALAETVVRTAEVQAILFPAFLALATAAALGVAWWLHVRLGAGSSGALGPLRSFRFPDPLIWLLIAGIGLLLYFGWTEGPGRVGANLVAFMTGLYVLRGTGVFMYLVGGVSLPGALLMGLATLLAPPVVLAGAMMVGLGDSWFDLRARRAARDERERD